MLYYYILYLSCLYINCFIKQFANLAPLVTEKGNQQVIAGQLKDKLTKAHARINWVTKAMMKKKELKN